MMDLRKSAKDTPYKTGGENREKGRELGGGERETVSPTMLYQKTLIF